MIAGLSAGAQEKGYDMFVPISKYISNGDSESLSAWFADNLEISILSKASIASKNQAKQILKTFFENYTPRSFTITHKAGRANMKYAIGNLNAGGETFRATVFVSYRDQSYKIQQLIVERIQ
ncbi:MAG: DUF4783 domain-containing protein [Bacteroidales bacterium]|nr:DUF4783 domain-containing protein [Bacteroidales bacterium]